MSPSQALYWLDRLPSTAPKPCAAAVEFASSLGAFEALADALKTPLGCSYIRWYVFHSGNITAPAGFTWRSWSDKVHAYFHTRVPYSPVWEANRRFALTWPAAAALHGSLITHLPIVPSLGPEAHWPDYQPEMLETLVRIQLTGSKDMLGEQTAPGKSQP